MQGKLKEDSNNLSFFIFKATKDPQGHLVELDRMVKKLSKKYLNLSLKN